MKTVINLNFQMASSGKIPIAMSLNREAMVVDSIGNIPSVGDYLCFDNEDEHEAPYQVKTRLFEYFYDDKSGSWSINANIVVERQEDEKYNQLIQK